MKNKPNNWREIKKTFVRYPFLITVVGMWLATFALVVIGPAVGWVVSEKTGIWIIFAGSIVFPTSLAVLLAAYGLDK